ncbi:MAG: hypothetical protein ACXVB1_08875 [Pseudobdellovibrionaceae bacterium]
MSKGQFIKACLQELTQQSDPPLSLTCAAKSQQDAKLLAKIEVPSRFSIDFSDSDRITTGLWNDSDNQMYYQDIAYVVKGGILGFGQKSLRIGCLETRDGRVQMADNNIWVDIQNNIDSRVTASVVCQ